MKYMLLLFSDPTLGPAPGTPESDAEMQQWFRYTDELAAAGHMVGGEALQPSETATTVRVRDGRTVTADGPFAESKEVLGGFYLIDVDDLDGAIEWAAKIPNSHYGSIEVRPIIEFDRG